VVFVLVDESVLVLVAFDVRVSVAVEFWVLPPVTLLTLLRVSAAVAGILNATAIAAAKNVRFISYP